MRKVELIKRTNYNNIEDISDCRYIRFTFGDHKVIEIEIFDRPENRRDFIKIRSINHRLKVVPEISNSLFIGLGER